MRVRALTGGLVCSLLALALAGAGDRSPHPGDHVASQLDREALASELVVDHALAPAAPALGVRWSVPSFEGQIGAVSLPTVYVGDLGDVAGVFSPGLTALRFFTQSGPTAYRSPALPGAQTVHAVYLLEYQFENQWRVVVPSGVLVGVIGPEQDGVTFVRAELRPWPMARGYWRVTWGFVWYSSLGNQVASAIMTSDRAEDHVCLTTARLCVSGPGYVRTGGYLDNTW
jgi:hypothetical protein